MGDESLEKTSLLRRGLAWGVHFYTALGALVGFLSLLAIFGERPREAFLWMLLAVAIDGTDGFLARRAQVKVILPGFDGAKLDDLVDYLNYVVVPTALLYHWGLLPPGLGIAFCAFPLIASAYGFCRTEAKTPDHFFTGFPSYWNVVVFYLYVWSTPPWINALIISILSVLVFVPLRFVYPSRTPIFKPLTCTLAALWMGVLAVLIWQIPNPSGLLLLASLFFPIYYVILSGILQSNRWCTRPR